MAKTITVTEVARSFAEYINRVAYRGERFILTRGNKPIAELRPLQKGRKLSDLPAILSTGPHLDPLDVEQFAIDIEEARNELAKIEVRDPWEV